MEAEVENIRKRYEAFRKGEEDVFSLIDRIILVLGEARKSGRTKIVEELEDMLIDLKFSVEEMI